MSNDNCRERQSKVLSQKILQCYSWSQVTGGHVSYRNDLIRYVMWFGKLDLIAAESFLNQHCPRWKEANPPKARNINVETDEYDDED